MTKYELRISSDLLWQAMRRAQSETDALVAIEVDRYDDGPTKVEFIARRLSSPGAITHSGCIALALADSAIDAFVHRVTPLTGAGFAGCILFGANGLSERGIGFVCIGGGVDWLQDLVLVRQTAPEGVIRWPLNCHVRKRKLGTTNDAQTGPEPELEAPRRLAVLGAGPMASTLATALFAAGLALRGEAFAADQAHAALDECDVLVVCLAEDERDSTAPLQALCDERLRLLVEVRAVYPFVPARAAAGMQACATPHGLNAAAKAAPLVRHEPTRSAINGRLLLSPTTTRKYSP